MLDPEQNLLLRRLDRDVENTNETGIGVRFRSPPMSRRTPIPQIHAATSPRPS